MNDRFAARRQQLLHRLKKENVEAILVTDFTNVTYLTGFRGDDSYLLLGRDQTVLISDSRYEVQIAEECAGLDAYIRSNRVPLIDATAKVIGKARPAKLAFESHRLTVEQHGKLQERLKSAELVPLSGVVEQLREIKDADEIASIRSAIRSAERGFRLLRASVVNEMTELEAAHDLEHAMRRFGASGAGFSPIVAAGSRSALPHARPGRTAICSGPFLLVDWGAESCDGYKSDLTRLLVTGKISPKLERIYGVVLKAQTRAIRAIRPGVPAAKVDRAARRVIEQAGYGKRFGHGLGHGIGLNIHEGPRLAPTSRTPLKPGMVVTVEPGIYLPGWGGVRIEDDVLVTRDGCEVLTSLSREIEQAVVG